MEARILLLRSARKASADTWNSKPSLGVYPWYEGLRMNTLLSNERTMNGVRRAPFDALYAKVSLILYRVTRLCTKASIGKVFWWFFDNRVEDNVWCCSYGCLLIVKYYFFKTIGNTITVLFFFLFKFSFLLFISFYRIN